MLETNLFLTFTHPLNELDIPYMVTGAVAAIFYGEPRLTHDVDLVIELDRAIVPSVCRAFPIERFYCPPEEIIVCEATRSARGHFNIIHHESGFKADIYLVGEDRLHGWGMANRRRVEVENDFLWLAPPEYVILRKLEYHHEGGSEKHIRDIHGMIEISGDTFDLKLITEKAVEMGTGSVWKRFREIDTL